MTVSAFSVMTYNAIHLCEDEVRRRAGPIGRVILKLMIVLKVKRGTNAYIIQILSVSEISDDIRKVQRVATALSDILALHMARIS